MVVEIWVTNAMQIPCWLLIVISKCGLFFESLIQNSSNRKKNPKNKQTNKKQDGCRTDDGCNEVIIYFLLLCMYKTKH